MLQKENGSEAKLLDESKTISKRKCDLNEVELAQYRVTTVKTIMAHWLFILQPIKEI